MLVLGCMRSASTSLTEFLIKTTGLSRHSVIRLPHRVKGYEHYPSSTASVISNDMLVDWVCSKEYIIQEHLLPIAEHRKILLSIPIEKRKVVITKRKWQDSFRSQMNRKGVCPYGSRTLNREACMQSFKKFREDLEIFFPEKDGYLHVEFENLVNNQAETLKDILQYFDIEHKKINLSLGHYK